MTDETDIQKDLPDLSRVSSGKQAARADFPLLETGVSGTAVFDGYVDDRETSSDLQGTTKYQTFANALVNVSIVSAGVRYFLNLISRPEWHLEPPEGVPGAERFAKLTESMMHSTDLIAPWQKVVRRAGLYRFHGNSVQEMTGFMRPDGVIGMRSIAARPQATIEQWDVDEHGHLYGVVQRSLSSGKDIYIPRWKMIYLVDDAVSDSPEGLGLFRHIVESVRRLKRYEQLEGWGFETDLRGIPLGRAPLAKLNELVKNGDITEAQKDEALRGLRSFLTGHVRNPALGLLLDSITYEDLETRKASGEKKWDLELLKAEATAQPEILRAIERLNREIARVLGIEQLLLGDNGVGSFAMSKDKSRNFALVVDSALLEIRQQFERDFIGFIWRLNGWPDEARPKILIDRLEYRDIEEVTGALEKLARAGAVLMPDDPAIPQLRQLMGLAKPVTIPDPKLAAEASVAAAPSLQPKPSPAPSNGPPRE